jgi:hypothetical protein
MTIQDLRDKNLIIFEGIVGSQAYGIATPASDVDTKGVYVQPLDDILTFGYQDQVSDAKNDNTFYEIRRFLELMKTNNPTILELLNLPGDCILHKDELFDKILSRKNDFITKTCKMSFGGYAVQQIKKARGMNKKIVTPMEKERKGVLDFCYVVDTEGQGSIPVKEFLEDRGMKQEHCGLISLPHMRYVYGLYYDKLSHLTKKGISFEFCPLKYFYKGIVQDEVESNDISLSSIEKGILPIATMYFNKDGYSIYCKEYREYWDWVENRNTARFSDNMLHGGGYDGKNLAHCHRLLDMAIEIGEGKGINVRRQNREQLLAIRRGEYSYDKLIDEANEKIALMDKVYETSSLPEEVDSKLVENLLLEIRKEWYKI